LLFDSKLKTFPFYGVNAGFTNSLSRRSENTLKSLASLNELLFGAYLASSDLYLEETSPETNSK